MKRPSKFLKDLLLRDGNGPDAQIIGVESDIGATRVYVATELSIEQGVVMRHYIRSEEVLLTDALKETLGIQPTQEELDEKRDAAEEAEGEEWKGETP